MPRITYAEYLAYEARTKRRAPVEKVDGPDREAELHQQILDFCNSRGWLAVHSRMDKRTGQNVGLTDFIVVTPKSVYWVEAKRPGQKLQPEQQAFAAIVRKLGWPHGVAHNMDEFVEIVKESLAQ